MIVEIYEGIDEIKKIMRNILILSKGETIYSIGKEGLFANHPRLKNLFEALKKKRAEKGIKFYAVYNIHKEMKKAKTKHTRIKYADLGNITNTEFVFYRDQLLIYVYSEENPRVILIKNKDIVDNMVNYFKFLWEKAIDVGGGP